MQETNVSNSQERESKRSAGLWATVFTWAGALASIALIVGIAFWTYRLGLRDAMDVPIIQAMAGPAKVAPEDPGGKVVPHQGLAVNEVLAGNGVEKLATLRTAPGSAGLDEEDEPQARLARLETVAKPVRRPATQKTFTPEPSLIEAKAAGRKAKDVDPLAGSSRVAEVQLPVFDDNAPFEVRVEPTVEPIKRRQPKLAETPQQVLTTTAPDEAPVRVEQATEPKVAEKPSELASEPLKLNVEQALAEVNAEQEAVKNVVVAALDTGGVSASLFAPARSTAPTPRKRPTVVASIAKPTEAKPNAVVAASQADRQDIKPGTRMVQLGAYGSEAVAMRQWDLITRNNSDLLGGKQRYIQRTKSNGKTFYRLRASSYPTLAASRAACSALSARGVPCIPTILK